MKLLSSLDVLLWFSFGLVSFSVIKTSKMKAGKVLWLVLMGLLLISIPVRASEDEIMDENLDDFDEKPGPSSKFDDDTPAVDEEPTVPLEDEKVKAEIFEKICFHVVKENEKFFSLNRSIS
jgi:hypothetical protein